MFKNIFKVEFSGREKVGGHGKKDVRYSHFETDDRRF
jgi:hypothetical protein